MRTARRRKPLRVACRDPGQSDSDGLKCHCAWPRRADHCTRTSSVDRPSARVVLRRVVPHAVTKCCLQLHDRRLLLEGLLDGLLRLGDEGRLEALQNLL